MTGSLLLIGLFLAVLVSIPFLIERLKRRYGFPGNAVNGQLRTVSALALGPHQKDVTVEVGPADARVWLVLGVTPQAIHCLHTVPVADSSPTIGISSASE